MDSDQQENKQTITLCMIVKDEASVILRALESVKAVVDCYCICDTGSTDGTQALIKEYFEKNNLVGKVFERPWKDFGYNRTECFNIGKETFKDSSYLMMLDADEVVVPYTDLIDINKKLTKPPVLEGDMVYITVLLTGTKYQRATFFHTSKDWIWEGVLHEYPRCEGKCEITRTDDMCNIPRYDGARSKDEDKYLKDAIILEEAVKKEPLNSRYWFYLAQCYADGGRYKEALAPLEKVIEISTWKEEKFIALLRKARYKKLSGIPFEEVVEDYMTAHKFKPDRVEPLYDLISNYRVAKNYRAAAALLETALAIPYPPTEMLFVEVELYDWRVKDEASLIYYYIGEPERALLLGAELLNNRGIPKEDHERIVKNYKFFTEAAVEKNSYPHGVRQHSKG